jgi:alpha-amylase
VDAILDLNYTLVNAAGNKSNGWPVGTLYNRILADCDEYKSAGFSDILLPPVLLGAGGTLSDGYDLKDNYELEGTAWGTKAELLAAVAAAHKAGLGIGLDLTLHQYDGYPNQIYPTPPFPKDPTCFAKIGVGFPGNVEADSVPDSSGNYPDGDLAAYDQPNRRMWIGAIAAAKWLRATVGGDWFRIDEAKGMHAPFVHALLSAEGLSDAWAVAEYFDGNPSALSGYVNYWMDRRVSVLDFNFKFNVGNICNNNSRAWMGQLANVGYALEDGMKAVTFLDSHDTDTSEGEQIIWNKALAVGIQMTWPGLPMSFYKDWSSDANCYNLKSTINNGLWIHKNLAQGEFVVRLDTDPQVFAMERMGYEDVPGCICFFNNDQWNEHTVTVQTKHGANIRLHEFSGNAGYNADRWTDANGMLTVTIPRNNNGLSYLVYGVYL